MIAATIDALMWLMILKYESLAELIKQGKSTIAEK